MSNPKIFLQPELIEGDNIDIAQDGKTISSNTPLENITDTEITEVEDGQALIYDETSGKWVNGEGGTPIEPNPAAAATDTLSTIKIDNTVFSIGGGGTGDAVLYPLTTAEYNALTPEQKMDENVLYLLTDGGSGGGRGTGSGYSETTLWENASGQSFVNSPAITLTLNDNISNYDMLMFELAPSNNPRWRYHNIALTQNIDKTGTNYFGSVTVGGTENYAPGIAYVDETSLSFHSWGQAYSLTIYKIVGIKYGGGGGSNVIPNPEDETTDVLHSIKIDDATYAIQGGGSFIDVENRIVALTEFTTSLTYTATEDCVVCMYLVCPGDASTFVKINDFTVQNFWQAELATGPCAPIFVRAGQTLTVTGAHTTYTSNYTVYGVQAGEGGGGGTGNLNAVEMDYEDWLALPQEEREDPDIEYFLSNAPGGGSGGSEVIPNPQGTATDTLNTVEIDGTVYEIEGGGTEVIPNPQGEATDTLNTVEIDGTVYNIESGEGSDVTITPTLNTGQKLADYSIDGTSGAIYMPTIASGDLIINPSETPTDELTKIGVSSSIEDAYLANGKIATSAGYYITCPLDKTLINGTYTVRVRDGASTYNFEVTYSGSTITKSWSSGSNNYTLTITSTTAGMSYYSGDYRNIYCDIVMMIPQIDVYSVSGGGGGSNLIIDAQRYSLEEQVVGIWTDGKPLYQRTWEFDTMLRVEANSWADSSILSADTHIDKIINANSIDQNGFNQKIGATTNGGAETYVRIFNYRSTIVILIKSLTLLYTKTTDTAGSGGYQAYGFSPIIYSETEREVGVWIDNKPLYQCTEHIILSTPIEPETETSVTLSSFSNAEKVFNISVLGGYKGSDSVVSKWVTFMEQSYIHTAADKVITNWNKNLMKVQSGSNYNNFPSAGVDNRFIEFYITIQYTKTTDVAGSGEYNTLAIPNVHYSTDEQVIGTWVDGSTLYQKTWHLTAPSTTNSIDLISFDGSNTIIRFEGYIKISNNCTQVGGESFRLWQRTATNYIACQVTNSAYINGDMYVTAVYTKTTE